MTATTPRELAKELIKPYVVRGDSLQQITEGSMGWGYKDFTAGIGKTVWTNGKRRDYSRYELVITKFDGKECLHIFSVPDLIAELKTPEKQLSLWEAAS